MANCKWYVSTKWLEQSHMKNIMKLSRGRKTQTISHQTNALNNLIRAEILRSQLATPLDIERGNWPMKKTKPNC
jgi:hypothetical protein